MTKPTIKLKTRGFTLIELLVVMAIMAVAIGVSMFGLSNSRLASRDNKRMSDLEQIRSALEIYRADCGSYPATNAVVFGSPLLGSGTPTSCSASNRYMAIVPTDPVAGRSFSYTNNGDGTYVLCAALEGLSNPIAGCVATSCGVSVSCNYLLTNP